VDLNRILENLEKLITSLLGADVTLDVRLESRQASIHADPGRSNK